MHLDPATSLAARPAPEIRDVAAEPGSILVVPVGSVEQHGEHLPVATDSLLAEAVAHGGVVEASGSTEDGSAVPALVAPAVWTGYSPHHLPFGGTLTLGFERLLGVLEDLAASGLHTEDGSGFDGVLLVNGHGGNAALVDGAVSTIGVAHPDAEVVGVTYFELAAGLLDDVRESEPGGMAHAGEFETSLMLHLYPELVGDDQPAEPLETPYDRGGKDLLEGGPVSAYRPFDEFSESGAIGAPEYASVETGAEIFALVTAELASLLGEMHDHARKGSTAG